VKSLKVVIGAPGSCVVANDQQQEMKWTEKIKSCNSDHTNPLCPFPKSTIDEDYKEEIDLQQ